jgi:hypothetical protein
MVQITIKDEDVYEQHKQSFEFISQFKGILSLAIKKSRLENDGYINVLQSSAFSLTPGFDYDFGDPEPIPQVTIDIYIEDDEDYLRMKDGGNYEEENISNLFRHVSPSNIFSRVYARLNAMSLYTGDMVGQPWRASPTYEFKGQTQNLDQDTIEKIWKNAGNLHVFISHKVEIKERAHTLKKKLEKYGIASFVAHDDIEPADEWQDAIEKALFSSDVLIALLSKDFSKSNWTDQEVGIAIGRELPIFPVMLEKDVDPYGFIGKIQAFKLKDTIIEDFVSKFLANKRTVSPAINSLLSALQRSADPEFKPTLVRLLKDVSAVSWKEAQKERFAEIYLGSDAIKGLLDAKSLYTELGYTENTSPVSSGDLDDEIPF